MQEGCSRKQPGRKLSHLRRQEDVTSHKQMKQGTAERKLMSSSPELCHRGVLKSSSLIRSLCSVTK